MAATGSPRDPVERLLDHVHAPPPSPALRARLYEGAVALPGRRRSLADLLPGFAASAFRPWAMGAVAAAAVVMAAYITTGERPDVGPSATNPAAATLALQYGAIHPADGAIPDTDGDEMDEDDDDEIFALRPLDGVDALDLALI
jgi:hypothetical protein